ncbi:carbonic anhydrase [Halotia branconii]|uniref:carbonic anhydrase n=1 Tax=Halotia branconii CENA392 TaxID=1539056 RepID=A0AAJ6NU74_9CYAN|nr:carbonic anhydrase family protein [Halotia branconii]WGV26601.1 carbonic anhydrase family protein [Halotia branconii CENA392]
MDLRPQWQKNIFLVLAFTLIFSPIPSVPSFAQVKTPDWSYGGAENPTRWGELDNNFALCESGKDQSPINIVDAVQGNPAQIVFNYKPTPLEIVNNGRTVQVNYAPGSSVTINGKQYALLQFHFHTPSEHTIEGNASAMELHLVHRNTAGELSVVGVMMNKGTANPVIDKIWQHIPSTQKTNTVSGQTINAADLLPKSKAYFSYSGSLTTPPCSESVKWNVLTEPITVSSEEIDTFEKLYQVNARPVQPTNDRKIELHGN